MYRTALIAGGIFAALGICDAAVVVGNWTFAQAQNLYSAGIAENGSLERSGKGDRLPLVKNADGAHTITTVEVVGLDAATVVYRDADGRILFRTDPVANVTVVSKGVRLPEVTIRERRDEPTRQVPIETPADGKERPRLVGCDPLASPLASVSAANLSGRCLVSTEGNQQVAELVR